MGRMGNVYIGEKLAGVISETDEGYSFQYLENYMEGEGAVPVSLTLPLREERYLSHTLFSFFDGLIPEGWLLDLVVKNWKLSYQDRFGVMLVSCRDCIGDVSIIPSDEQNSIDNSES